MTVTNIYPSELHTPGISSEAAARDSGDMIARVAAIAVGLGVILLIALMIWGLGRRAEGTVGQAPVRARPAPSFTLPLFDGGVFTLDETRGRPVLINFWASWCVPCEDEAPVLERAYREYRDRVSFIGVDIQDTDANAIAFLRRFGVTYPNGRDATGEIAVDYGMSGYPETYFVDRSGMLVRKWQGPLDDRQVRGYLDELMR